MMRPGRRYAADQRALDAKTAFKRQASPAQACSLTFLSAENAAGAWPSLQGSIRLLTVSRDKGMCGNKVTIRQDVLEERVIGTLRARLMRPELTEIFCREYTNHLNKVRMEHNAQRAAREKNWPTFRQKIDKVIDSIKAGIDVALIKDEAPQCAATSQGTIGDRCWSKPRKPRVCAPKKMGRSYCQGCRRPD